MESTKMEFELVNVEVRKVEFDKGWVKLRGSKKGNKTVYNRMCFAKDIIEASCFREGDRVNLMALPDGSMFKIVDSNVGLLTFRKTENSIALNSRDLCAEVFSRTMKGFGKEIIKFKARVTRPGEIQFWPEE